MKRVTDLIRESVERKAFPKPMPSLDELRASERVPEFDRLCDNRLIVGAFRYGLMIDKAARLKRQDTWGYIEGKWNDYKSTGNLECLVDMANLLKLEFSCPKHPDAHFTASDDVGHLQDL